MSFQIVGKTLYGFIAGADPNEGAGLFTKAEVTYRDLNQDNVTFDFISEFNNTGVCVNASIFSTNVFDIAGNGDRAAFSLPNGRYNVLFSSQPESYIWNLQCAQSGGRTLRCPSENLSVVLLTLASPPNNINLEEIGSDLRRRTCLTMEEIPDTFTWAFIQGQNNCTEIVVPGNK